MWTVITHAQHDNSTRKVFIEFSVIRLWAVWHNVGIDVCAGLSHCNQPVHVVCSYCVWIMQMFTGLFKPPDWFNDVMGLWLNVEESLVVCNLHTLRPRQNVRLSTDDIFTCIFLNENMWILINISLKFVSMRPINNLPTLVQKMAWRWQAIIWTNDCTVYWRINASLNLNELKVMFTSWSFLFTMIRGPFASMIWLYFQHG